MVAGQRLYMGQKHGLLLTKANLTIATAIHDGLLRSQSLQE